MSVDVQEIEFSHMYCALQTAQYCCGISLSFFFLLISSSSSSSYPAIIVNPSILLHLMCYTSRIPDVAQLLMFAKLFSYMESDPVRGMLFNMYINDINDNELEVDNLPLMNKIMSVLVTQAASHSPARRVRCSSSFAPSAAAARRMSVRLRNSSNARAR